MEKNDSTPPKKLFVQMALAAWDMQNNRFAKLVESLPEGRLLTEIAPGKNTGVYLLGHLVAVSDHMLPLLGLGERLYPHLEEVFIGNPDTSGLPKPPVSELKANLEAVNKRLSEGFAAFSPENWFERHNAVSETDFEKEPHRNKLNLLLNRTGHLAYHFGQMALLKQ